MTGSQQEIMVTTKATASAQSQQTKETNQNSNRKKKKMKPAPESAPNEGHEWLGFASDWLKDVACLL